MRPRDLAPLSELRKHLAPDERAGVDACLRVVDSMTQDYHDCKGHPTMSLDEHLALLPLSLAQSAFVRMGLEPLLLDASGFAALRAPEWLRQELGLPSDRYAEPTWRSPMMVRVRLRAGVIHGLVPQYWFLCDRCPGIAFG